jgi:membrane peptidoglycan carboxypeptidase
VPSLTLGTSSVNVLEMADAYGTLASGGIRHDPKAIVRVVLPSGKVDYRAKITGTRALPAGVASVVNSALSAVPRDGTGWLVSNYISRACAGKTGTTDLNTDAWYVGYTPNLAAGIWVGNADGSPMALGNSIYVAGNYCAPIWGEFMQTALQGLPALDFQTAYWPFMPWKGHWSTVSPSPSPSPSKSPSKSPKPTPTPTKTIVGPSPSPSPSPSKSPSPSPKPSPSPTKSP